LIMNLIIGYLLTGCVSYIGQYDNSIPMYEQATIKIPSELSIIRVNGVPYGMMGLSTVLVNFPSGEYTFTFAYASQYSTSTTTTTTTASGMVTTATLKPGYLYRAEPRFYTGNRIGVEIIEEKSGQPQNTFTALEFQIALRTGGTIQDAVKEYPESYDIGTEDVGGLYWDLGGEIRIGQVFDGNTIHGWHAYLGIDFIPLFFGGIVFYSGLAYEYYIPNSKIGFGIGGAMNYRLEFGGDVILYPSVRFEFIPWRPSFKFGIYGEYRFQNYPIVGDKIKDGWIVYGNTFAFGIFLAY